MFCGLVGNEHVYYMQIGCLVTLCCNHCACMHACYNNDDRRLDINKTVCVIFIIFTLY